MENHSSTNTLDFHDRIAVGKKKEQFVLDFLSKNVQTLPGGKEVLSWIPASQKDDMISKIDIYANLEDGLRACQVKIRETGYDLGLSLVRPWESFESFKDEYISVGGFLSDKISWDRDYPLKHPYIEWYIFYCEQTDHLFIAKALDVRNVVAKVLHYFTVEEEFNGSYERDNIRGAELKLVKDRGDGFTALQEKLICYITPALLIKFGNTDYYNIGKYHE